MTRTDESRFPGTVKVMTTPLDWAASVPSVPGAPKDRAKVGAGTWCTCSRRCSGVAVTHCVDSQVAALTRSAFVEAARVQAVDADPIVQGLRIAEAELLAALAEIERRCAR